MIGIGKGWEIFAWMNVVAYAEYHAFWQCFAVTHEHGFDLFFIVVYFHAILIGDGEVIWFVCCSAE